MNADQYFDFLCKKQPKKQSKIKTLKEREHNSIASIIIESAKTNVSQGIEKNHSRMLPLPIFIEPII